MGLLIEYRAGPFGFQLPVLAAKPGDQGFSPLWKLNLVERNQNVNPRELKPAQEIMGAQQNRSLTVKKTDVVVNHPVIKWDGGSLKIKEYSIMVYRSLRLSYPAIYLYPIHGI